MHGLTGAGKNRPLQTKSGTEAHSIRYAVFHNRSDSDPDHSELDDDITTITRSTLSSYALTYLHRAGFSKKDIKELVALVKIWNKSMAQGNGNGISGSNIMNVKLDTELIYVGAQANNGNGNLQQPNNGNNNPAVLDRKLSPVEGNNGYGSGNFTMNDYLRLQLLQASTSNILTKTSCSP